MSELPMVALSIRQPWAWLIVAGFKTVENRSRRTHFRGSLMIHASKAVEQDEADEVSEDYHPITGRPFRFDAPMRWQTGGIIGIVEVVDCVESSASDYFVGPFGWVLENPRPINFIPCRGQLGFFRPDLSAANPKGDAR